MRLVPLNLTIISCVCVAVGVSQAQNIDPAEAYDKAVAALDAGDFATGMEVVDSVIDRYKDTGLSRFGPVFGHFYYLRGMLYIRQKKFDEAIEPLKICYEEFGNDKRQEGFPPNLFHVHALVQWASCLQAQEKYSEAIAMFEKALAEDPKREPRINRMGVQMNLGRCYMRTGQEEKGRELLNDVLGLEGLPADAVQDAFTVLAWDSEDANPAQMMQVIQQHAGSLFGSAEDRDVMNPRMASLAVKALNDKDPLGALVWYNLMTAPQEIIDAKMARKEQLLGRKEGASEELAKRIDEAVTAIDEEIATKKDEHANALLGMGAAHYQVRSYSAARAVYQQLLAHFPDLEERAIVLHNLVVIGTKQANWEEASAYGKQFFDEFPSHDFRPAIARILAEVVFLDEDFALAQEMAAEARKGLPAGPEREGLDFVVAASLFQLGQVGPAEAELDSFVKNYQTGQRLESAKFYLASLKVRNGDWPTAAPMLDEYADAYPDSPFRASALHLASLAYLILGNPNEALIRVNTLLGDHRDAPEVPAALNVKGDVQTALGDTYESITTSYLTSRQMVEGQNIGTPETAAYALRQLIALATNAKEYEEAIGYLESFRERYQSTSFNTGATIAALNAFIETDRADEARQLLEGHINELRGGESSAALDETFQAYAAFLRDQFGQDKVIEYLTNFKADSQTPQLSAWLHLGQIETHEASPKPDQAAIDAQFEEINKLYASSGNALSNYALVRLARWRSDTKGDE
ncbi:MAG: tetratricopeptide repeat protein, partial [Verrucomicrobiota bacterium]